MAAKGEGKVEMKAHQGSYNLFTAIIKWGSIASAVAVAIVILLIS